MDPSEPSEPVEPWEPFEPSEPVEPVELFSELFCEVFWQEPLSILEQEPSVQESSVQSSPSSQSEADWQQEPLSILEQVPLLQESSVQEFPSSQEASEVQPTELEEEGEELGLEE